MVDVKKQILRPTSPYLTVYKPQVGSLVSIMGRFSGLILSVYLLLYFFLCYGKDSLLHEYFFYSFCFDFFHGGFDQIFVSFGVLFLLLSFVYHLLFSCRYLYWSWTGGYVLDYPLNLEGLYLTANYLVGLTFSLTLFFWFVV